MSLAPASNLSTISPEAAKREKARREMAGRRLVNYSEYVAPWYRTQRFHKLIASKLEEVEFYIANRGQPSKDGRTGISRLIIQMPPRYGKTELASRLMPSWFLGRNPDMRVILSSYGADLATDNSRAVRSYIDSKEYENVFGRMSAVESPVDVSADSRKVSAWDLTAPHRGGLVAAGVGGGITGKGAHLLVLDDLYKDRQQAESEAYRKEVMDWWGSVAYQRLQAFAAVVIIMTRWHPDDIVGQLLKEMAFNDEAERWEVLSLPTIAPDESEYAKDEEEQASALAQGLWVNLKDPLDRQPGEVLWPTEYSPEEVRRKKANTPPHDWMALHDQMPRSRTGGYFEEKKWETWPLERVPADLQWFRVWDLAVGERARNDRTAGATVAMDIDGNWYVRDLRKWRLSWPKSRLKLIETSEELGAGEIWGIESTAFQLAAVQEMLAEPRMATRAIYDVAPEKTPGKATERRNPAEIKANRALSLQSRQEMGKVILVDGPWVREFLEEAAAFPRGKHDDQIDTVVLGMQLIAEYKSRQVPTGRSLIAVV